MNSDPATVLAEMLATQQQQRRARKTTVSQPSNNIPPAPFPTLPQLVQPPANVFSDNGLSVMQLQSVLSALTHQGAQNHNSLSVDPAVTILSLATQIAANMVALNQQPILPSLGNPLMFANAAKLLMGLNSIPTPAVSTPAENPLPDMLSTLMHQLQQQQPVQVPQQEPNLSNMLLIQQYMQQQSKLPTDAPNFTQAPISPQRNVSGGHRHRSHTMSLKRAAASSSNQPARKRSMPLMAGTRSPLAADVFDSPSAPFRKPSDRHVHKDDVDRCLNRILREELLNIFEDDHPAPIQEELKVVDLEVEVKKEVENRNPAAVGGCDSAFSPVASAFRKVMRPVMLDDRLLQPQPVDRALSSVSPEGACESEAPSPPAPLPESLLTAIKDVALLHRSQVPNEMRKIATQHDFEKVCFALSVLVA